MTALLLLLFFGVAVTISRCKIGAGITNSCDDIQQVGGVGKTFWVGYLSDLSTPISQAKTGPITTLSFKAYGGLYRFDGQKFSHTFGSELSVAAGGNKSRIHTFTAKLFTNDTTDDVTLETLDIGDDIFIVAQDNNQRMYILGAANGMSSSADVQNTGQTGDSDTTDNITLTGQEKGKPLRFDLGTYAATLARIESYQI